MSDFEQHRADLRANLIAEVLLQVVIDHEAAEFRAVLASGVAPEWLGAL